MNTGIAIVPEIKALHRLVELQRSLLQIASLSPLLGTEENLPHITLLQGKTVAPLCSHSELEYLASQLQTMSDGVSLRISQFEYIEGGWYFLKIHRDDWLQTLHDTAFAICRDRLIVDHNETNDFLGYNEEQKQNHLQYGYRYIGTQFTPHFTIGRTLDKKRSTHEEKFLEIVNTEISNFVIYPDRFTLYRMGENGSHALELDSTLI